MGQTPDRPYDERQRYPGDYDALVGQRSIAIHSLEHLSDTDRGVILWRKFVREGIEAVQNGDLPGVFNDLKDGEVIRIFSSDTVLRLPPAVTPQEDRSLLRQTGWTVAHNYYKKHPALAGEIVKPEEMTALGGKT